MYADYEYYRDNFGGKVLDENTAPEALEQASEAVDILTYCRIKAAGFDNLTEHQQTTIKRVVCRLAQWQYENADGLESPYKQYSINGVSMTFGASDTVRSVCGVLIPLEIYSLLLTTGLCGGVI